MQKKTCIVCNHTQFEMINSFTKFPIMAVSNDSLVEQYCDFNIIACKQCKCLQLQNWVDPTILYSDVYMNSHFSPSWKDHNLHFAEFILENSGASIFLEIGANKGDLYKILSNKREVSYSTLDMFKDSELPSQIKFIDGNWETFNFESYDTVIASHVFEHLYSPLTCIENLQKANVSEIFISIPNFEKLLEDKSSLLINSQHIYYCGYDYIIYMFSLFNYTCKKHVFYNGNIKSNMFRFSLADRISNKPKMPSTDIQLYKEIYVNNLDFIKTLDIPKNCYIAPSGMYGQFLYYFINKKENILGFLDNNPDRHGKKLYGTDKLVYSPSSIDFDTATIIVCDCPYKEEIIKQLQNICNHVTFFR